LNSQSAENAEIQKRISDRLVDLIDIVFGVVVAVNFAMLFKPTYFETIPVIGQIVTLPNISLIVAYAAIILSWVGYHQLIEYNPYNLNAWGYGRFSLDVIIVFIYTILMYSTENTTLYLACYPIIFLIYAIAGVVRNKEYKAKVSWPKGSLKYTLYFSIILAFWIVWEHLVSFYPAVSVFPLSWVMVAILLPVNLIYRYNRAKRGFIRKK
jgi:hypothetical protein